MPTEQRITLRQLAPNPLFEQWLSEWLSYAERKNSMKKHALAKALESLRRYPLVMHSGRDCCILDGFGQTICRMIDKQLEVYRGADVGGTDVPTTGRRRPMSEADCERSMHEVIDKVRVEMVKKKKVSVKAAKKMKGPHQNPLSDLFDKYDLAEVDALIDAADAEAEPIEIDSMPIIVPANSYEVILLVDTQETVGLVCAHSVKLKKYSNK